MIRESGFTLLELIIVTSIVSILSLIASNNFKNMQLRAHQVEAKVFLGSSMLAESVFFMEAGGPTGCLADIGFDLSRSGSRYYSIGVPDALSKPYPPLKYALCGPLGIKPCFWQNFGTQEEHLLMLPDHGTCTGFGGVNSGNMSLRMGRTFFPANRGADPGIVLDDDRDSSSNGIFHGLAKKYVTESRFMLIAAGSLKSGSRDIWTINMQKILNHSEEP